ncbi:hypothetical protein DL764_006704 [Monosporascus ibericus]|uniref:TauD/TfdA-like domain-containing protein n=1 Tax=Monosporascus ibericus TaxID=155417 RepID=A0A4Q4T780_9PEZI|nr:hypothetical protein DL764_006704 [Monosporascus ibericus]
MDVHDVGSTLAEGFGNVAPAGPACGHGSDTDELCGIPAGFPPCLSGKSVWTGAQFQDETRFIHVLTEDHLAEIPRALARFKEQLSQDVYNGNGFCVIRGINKDDYSVEDLTVIWLGIQAYIADQRGRQDHRGNMLGGPQSSRMPLSRLMMNFGRTPLLGNAVHPRPEHLPKLSECQREALDTVEAIAQAVQLEIRTRAGDMHFINNFTVLHRREGFVDGAGPREKRHLVRMILRSSELGWSIPEELKQDWYDAFEVDSSKTWHLEPMPSGAFPLRKYTN